MLLGTSLKCIQYVCIVLCTPFNYGNWNVHQCDLSVLKWKVLSTTGDHTDGHYNTSLLCSSQEPSKCSLLDGNVVWWQEAKQVIRFPPLSVCRARNQFPMSKKILSVHFCMDIDTTTIIRNVRAYITFLYIFIPILSHCHTVTQ